MTAQNPPAWFGINLLEATPRQLAEILMDAGEHYDRVAFVDGIFEASGDQNVPMLDLAWRLNDIAMLLKQSAGPREIRHCPYRGLVADFCRASLHEGCICQAGPEDVQ